MVLSCINLAYVCRDLKDGMLKKSQDRAILAKGELMLIVY